MTAPSEAIEGETDMISEEATVANHPEGEGSAEMQDSISMRMSDGDNAAEISTGDTDVSKSQPKPTSRLMITRMVGDGVFGSCNIMMCVLYIGMQMLTFE